MPAKLPESEVRQRLAARPGWTLEGDAITRAFTFPDHITAFGFVTRVSMAAEAMDHHPDLRIVYNRVEIRLWSHDANGLTDRDFRLAEKIDHYL